MGNSGRGNSGGAGGGYIRKNSGHSNYGRSGRGNSGPRGGGSKRSNSRGGGSGSGGSKTMAWMAVAMFGLPVGAVAVFGAAYVAVRGWL